MLQGFLIGLGGESFFAAVRRGANLYFFTTGHHFYNRKPRNKYILLYSTLYSTTSILLQKSLNLTPIQGFLGRLLPAALLRCFAFSSPGWSQSFLLQNFFWEPEPSFLAPNFFLGARAKLFGSNFFWWSQSLELFRFSFFFGAEARAWFLWSYLELFRPFLEISIITTSIIEVLHCFLS